MSTNYHSHLIIIEIARKLLWSHMQDVFLMGAVKIQYVFIHTFSTFAQSKINKEIEENYVIEI